MIFSALLLITQIAHASDTTLPFRFRLFQEPVSLDWSYKRAFYEIAIVMNIMEGLVEVDDQFNPQPVLASKWEVSPDNLTYTFTLRSGCLWSDGKAVKAEDFKYALERALTPSTKSEFANYLYDIAYAKEFNKGVITDFNKVGIKALDDSRLQIKLKRAAPHFIQLFHHYVTFPQRKDLVEKSKTWWTPPGIVTVGPYRIKNWDHGKLMTFEKNKSYCATQGKVDQVDVIYERKDDQVKVLAEENKLDVLFNASTSDIVKFTTQLKPPWKLKHFEALNTTFLAFNVKNKWGSNDHLRKALAMALDLSKINDVMQSGLTPAQSLIPTKMTGASPVKLAIDLVEARKSLALAGWPSTNPPKLELTFRDGMHNKIATYIAEILKQNLDIELTLVPVPPGEFVKTVESGKSAIAIETYWADYPDPARFIKLFSSDSAFNRSNWKNAEYNALIEKADDSPSLIEKASYYQKAQQLLIHDEAIAIPLYHSKSIALLSNRIANFEVNPMTSHWFFKKISIKQQ